MGWRGGEGGLPGRTLCLGPLPLPPPVAFRRSLRPVASDTVCAERGTCSDLPGVETGPAANTACLLPGEVTVGPGTAAGELEGAEGEGLFRAEKADHLLHPGEPQSP